MKPKYNEKKYKSKITPKIPKKNVSNPTPPNSEKYKPKINPKLNRYLVATKNTKSKKNTQKTDWLTVEDVKVHKWMKI